MMLDGELAVPCDLQAAIAGSNAHRGETNGMQIQIRSVDSKVLYNLAS